uniref:Gamma-aminobutyric acid type B receptor subunit 1-like n=1 Tax=Saccoglossus kowalevskii TaxID=10224 RepID=A0ABM0MHP6_SACKO
MAIGGGCSVSTAPVAAFSHLFNVIQVSYASSTPQLSNKLNYPLFFRTKSSDVDQNIGRIAIMKYYGWKRAATLYQDDMYFVMVIHDMIRRMQINGIKLLASLALSNDPFSVLKIIQETDARIIIVHAYENYSRVLFCE